MAIRQPLPPKVRWVLALIPVMILAILFLAVRSYVAAERANKNIVDTHEPTDERLVSLGGHTLLLEPGALVREIADWADIGDEHTLDFELGDPLFAPKSTQLSKAGAIRLRQFSMQMMAHPAVTVRIFVPTAVGSVNIRRLENDRAMALRQDLANDSVAASRVIIADETEDQPTAASPQLAVLLSK